MAKKPLDLLRAFFGPGKGREPQPPATLPPRPEGGLVWVHTGGVADHAGARLLAEALAQDLAVVLTSDTAIDAGDLPEGVIAAPAPPDIAREINRFLDHWAPAALVLTGSGLSPALVREAAERKLPVLWVDAAATRADEDRWRWMRGARQAMARCDRILARDTAAAVTLRRTVGREANIEVGGELLPAAEPLRHTEAERESLARLLASRPVWLAVACPEAEEPDVLAAHAKALRQAHRMLLILAPADPSRAAVLADRLTAEGWEVADRARDEEPEDGVQIFVTDGPTELGLWYRLAPVTFIGGTLSGGAIQSPLEAAALGSAIVHGPATGVHEAAFSRLAAARAARRVSDGAALADAVADLIAPDRAAQLAHNAWAVSSAGAEVTARLRQMILDRIKEV